MLRHLPLILTPRLNPSPLPGSTLYSGAFMHFLYYYHTHCDTLELEKAAITADGRTQASSS